MCVFIFTRLSLIYRNKLVVFFLIFSELFLMNINEWNSF